MRTTVAALAMALLCSCAIDDRGVEVGRVCMDPQSDLISDFSTSRAGYCPEATCPATLKDSPTVSLGDPTVSLGRGVRGLVYPYRRPASVELTLTPSGDLTKGNDPDAALHVVVSYDAAGRDPPPIVGAFALQLLDCVTTSGFTGVSFHLAGELGTCPLRFTARFAARGDDPTTLPCALDDCYAATTLAATTGDNTAFLPAAPNDRVFLGLQWELGPPPNSATTCHADFTIDDVRLEPVRD
jgi:hypothetical protein